MSYSDIIYKVLVTFKSFIKYQKHYPSGSSIKYVRTEGEGGLSQCVRLCISKWMTSQKLRTWGGGGVKNPENFAYVLYGWPLRIWILYRRCNSK